MTRNTKIEVSASATEPPLIEFHLNEKVEEGVLLRLRASGTSMLSNLIVDEVCSGEGVSLPVVHRYSRADMEENWTWYIQSLSSCICRVPDEMGPGDVLQIRSQFKHANSDDSPGPALYSGLSWYANLEKIDTKNDTDGSPVAEPVELFFVSGSVDHIEAYLKPDGTLRVEHFDVQGNPTSSNSSRITVTGNNIDTAVGCPDDTRAAAIKLAGPPDRVTVDDGRGCRTRSSALPRAIDDTPIFFGEFHWHTNFSGDGQRSHEAALTSARDELCLDFAGPADHMVADGTYGEKTPTEQAEKCRPFDQPGAFCTIPTAELSRRYGHANILCDNFKTFCEVTGNFPDTLEPNWTDPNRYGLRELADASRAGRCIIIPHHTNTTSWVSGGVVHPDGRPFWCAMTWPIPPERKLTRLVEIVQGRGSFEAEEVDERWRIQAGGYGASARMALNRGYRLGFTGGTDNHKGWPTRKNSGYAGLTAVLTSELDTGSVFDALHARRCYATSGVRIVADATLNGQPMGSEVDMEPDDTPQLQIMIKGTAPLTDVQIVHSGHVLDELDVPSGTTDFTAEWADDRPGRPLQDAYYYVRARQEDGHCVWLSPWWVDLPEDGS